MGEDGREERGGKGREGGERGGEGREGGGESGGHAPGRDVVGVKRHRLFRALDRDSI